MSDELPNREPGWREEPAQEYHCWNCGNALDPRTVKKELDGTIVGTCWHCCKDCVSAIENEE